MNDISEPDEARDLVQDQGALFDSRATAVAPSSARDNASRMPPAPAASQQTHAAETTLGTGTEQLPPAEPDDKIGAFWATHDSAPYFEQWEDVTHSPPHLQRGPERAGARSRKRPLPGRMDLVSIRLPADTVEAIKAIAVARHLPYQTLMRSWIMERLVHEEHLLRRPTEAPAPQGDR